MRVTQASDEAGGVRQLVSGLAEDRDVVEGRAEGGRTVRGSRGIGKGAATGNQRGGRCAGSGRALGHIAGKGTLGLGARVERTQHIGQRLIGGRGQAEFLGEGVRGLRTRVMQLGKANIGAVEPVTVTDFGVVPAAIGGDAGQVVIAQTDVSLERNAPAFFQGRGDQVLRHGAGICAQRRGQGQEAEVGGRHASASQRASGDDIGAAIVVVLVIVSGEVEAQIVARLVQELAAHAVVLVAVDPRVGGGVADVAIILAVEAGEPGSQILADRQVDRTLQAIFVAIEIAGFKRAAEFHLRHLGGDVDHTGRCVLAEQRALRAAQNFHLGHVDHVREGFARTGIDHAVNHGRNRRLTGDRESGRADAAQEDRLVQRRARLQEVERRHHLRGAFDRRARGFSQAFAAEHRNGNRHVLHVFRALLGGNDDFARGAIIVLGRVLGIGRGGKSNQSQRCQGQGRRGTKHRLHGSSSLQPGASCPTAYSPLPDRAHPSGWCLNCCEAPDMSSGVIRDTRGSRDACDIDATARVRGWVNELGSRIFGD